MKEHFAFQFDNNPKVTKSKLEVVTQKHYTSGRDIKVGDTVLFAVTKKGEDMELICLHESELDDYEYVGEGKEHAPEIKLK